MAAALASTVAVLRDEARMVTQSSWLCTFSVKAEPAVAVVSPSMCYQQPL